MTSVVRDALIRETLLNGKDHGMFDLLILTSTDQLPLILKSYLNEEVYCTHPSPSVKIPSLNVS